VRRDEPTADCKTLEERVFSVKRRFLAMYKKANAGHIGSSLSCAELLVFLKFGWMRDDDTLILSKGHAVAALYSLLAELNRFTPSQIDSYYEDGTLLPALPPFNAFEDIPLATGSLGHGLPVSAGIALGVTLNGQSRRVFCVTSDGELDEGSVWEAALFIAHRKLKNVIWLIDRNGIQGIGRTEDVLGLEPLDEKLRAFGYHVVSVDGHDFAALLDARSECLRALDTGERPVAIIARTVKGNGLGSLADTVDSHYLPLDDERYRAVLDELSRTHEAKMASYQNAR
jgi:transketolase